MTEEKEDRDTVALRTMATNEHYSIWTANTALELASNNDERVEILVDRGLQAVRRLVCATHPAQMGYANAVLAAEMVSSIPPP